MAEILLSTSNLMQGGPSITPRPAASKSNLELMNALKAAIADSATASSPEPEPAHLQNVQPFISPSTTSTTDAEQSPVRIVNVPSPRKPPKGLAEPRFKYDITLKLFLLPTTLPSQYKMHVQHALQVVLDELQVSSVNLLIVSFPGVSFDADDDADGADSHGKGDTEQSDLLARTWQRLEELHDQDVVGRLGVAEFGSERLRHFLPRTRIPPAVDQINVRDCCVVPKPLILFAKEHGIELLTHNDCTNILSKGTIRELLTPDSQSSAASGPLSPEDLAADIEPQWVIKYTAVVRDRGVIENKGYFAMARLQP